MGDCEGTEGRDADDVVEREGEETGKAVGSAVAVSVGDVRAGSFCSTSLSKSHSLVPLSAD